MNYSLKRMQDFKIEEQDGEMGSVDDVFFDEAAWTLRYLIVDTGGWLFGRKVLVSPVAVKAIDDAARLVSVALTREQIKHSPEISADPALTREQEATYRDYFGWPYYWQGSAIDSAALTNASPEGMEVGDIEFGRGPDPTMDDLVQRDTLLRSARDTIGYAVQAAHEEVGNVEDFLIDDDGWSIPYLVVKLLGAEERFVLLPTELVHEIGWPDKYVAVGVSVEDLQKAPAYSGTSLHDKSVFDKVSSYFGHRV